MEIKFFTGKEFATQKKLLSCLDFSTTVIYTTFEIVKKFMAI